MTSVDRTLASVVPAKDRREAVKTDIAKKLSAAKGAKHASKTVPHKRETFYPMRRTKQ